MVWSLYNPMTVLQVVGPVPVAAWSVVVRASILLEVWERAVGSPPVLAGISASVVRLVAPQDISAAARILPFSSCLVILRVARPLVLGVYVVADSNDQERNNQA